MRCPAFHRNDGAGSAAGPFAPTGQPELEDAPTKVSVGLYLYGLEKILFTGAESPGKPHEVLRCEHTRIPAGRDVHKCKYSP